MYATGKKEVKKLLKTMGLVYNKKTTVRKKEDTMLKWKCKM